MSLGDKINEIRREKTISIDELCERSGVPKGTLSKITAGITANPTLDTVRVIAQALGCTLDDLDDKPSNAHDITPSERTHIQKYRRLTDNGRATVDQMMDALLETRTEPKAEEGPKQATIKIAAKGRGPHEIEMDEEKIKELKRALDELPNG